MATRQPSPHAATAARAVLLCLAAFAAVLAAASSRQSGQSPAPAQTPTFRAAANFVQVDAYPTADGRPVADLTKNDFEVLEDGVAQSLATFEHVSVRPAGAVVERRDPTSTRHERDLVADIHNRLFVLFLDTYHVTDPTTSHARGADSTLRMPGSPVEARPPQKKPLGPQPIDKAIVNFLERFVGPDDLVAAMSPEMDAGRMVFGRRPERFAEWVGTAWARRFSWDDMDPEEEAWALSYPPDPAGDPNGCFRGIWEEMVSRRREKLTLRAVEDTVARLGVLREGRKAVLLVSEGWPMFRPNPNLARPLPLVSEPRCPPTPPPSKGIYVGPGGKLQVGGTDPRNPGQPDRSAADAARLELALLDNEASYRRLLDRANGQNVTFYPIDPRGLAVFDTPFEALSTTRGRSASLTDDMNRLRGRLETLHNLASATDGFMSASNDLDAAMKRIAEDMSDYYLLGYNSTNTALDGKFRRITVRVKRPGVQVRARRGYVAATEAEMRAATGAAATVDPATRLREAALASLGTMPANLSLRVSGGFDWVDGASALWTVAELGAATARLPEWQDGGQAEVAVTAADGSVVASGTVPLSAAARSFLWRPGGGLQPGDYTVRVTGRPSVGGSIPVGGLVRVTLPATPAPPNAQPATPRVFRRGPSTGLGFAPTIDERFRRVERVRVELSLAANDAVSARLLDRLGLPLAVPATAAVREENGLRVAAAEAALASLAPGDYLLEVTLGEGPSRQTVVVPIRVIP